jgi:hypothetical protein
MDTVPVIREISTLSCIHEQAAMLKLTHTPEGAVTLTSTVDSDNCLEQHSAMSIGDSEEGTMMGSLPMQV